MSSPEESERDRWTGYLDARTAGSPPPPLEPAAREALDALGARLDDEALWTGPSPQARAALLEQVRQGGAESVPLNVRTLPDRSAGPAAADERAGPRRGRGRRPAVALLAAAAAAVVVGLIGVAAWPRGPAYEFAVAGTALAPQARAIAEVTPKSAGVAIRLQITGLKAAPPGSYYAAWLKGPQGTVPVGTFHWRKGGIPIDLWSGVTTDRYPELFVTLQQEGATATPSDRVFLDGRAPA